MPAHREHSAMDHNESLVLEQAGVRGQFVYVRVGGNHMAKVLLTDLADFVVIAQEFALACE